MVSNERTETNFRGQADSISVSQGLLRPEFNSPTPMKKPFVAAHTCNPSDGTEGRPGGA